MTKAKTDEEDYWNSSNLKIKPFTFDDEDDDFTKLKESKRAVSSIRGLLEDDEEVERVSWSGEPVGSISWSVGETASSLRGPDSASCGTNTRYTTAPLTKNNSGYSLSSLFKGKQKGGGFQSLSEAIGDISSKHYSPEIRKPKSEYKDHSSVWSPEVTVMRMQQGKAVSLEQFRSLQDKLDLLDQAVSHDEGNIVTAILIFLQKSLSKEVLCRELVARETALHHYIHFLKEMGDREGLLQLYRALGRTEDIALLKYKEHLSIKEENKKRDFLKSCLSLPFSPEDSVHVQDHYTLLERQIIIETSDRQAESSGQNDVFSKHPRKSSILHMPLITTLYYCCMYHYNEPEGTFSSPANIRKTFRVGEKQYLLAAVGARARLRAWQDVDQLLTSKSWFGFTRRKSAIAFQRVVEVLQRNNAPVQVLQEYVQLVEDTQVKLSLAVKYKCHSVVVNTYRELKDRQRLLGYQGKVEKGSTEARMIEDLLSNPQIRWKN